MNKKSIGHETRTQRWGYVFVTPFVVVFCIFNLWPTLNTFLLSFSNLKGFTNELNFIGNVERKEFFNADTGEKLINVPEYEEVIDTDAGEKAIKVINPDTGKEETFIIKTSNKRIPNVLINFGRLITDPYFWGALSNTFIIWGINFTPQLGLALILSIWLSDIRLGLAGKNLFRTIVYMPNLLTAASVAMLFRSIFGYGGPAVAPANQFLGYFGIRATFMVDGIPQLDANGEVIKEAINFFRSVAFSRGLVAFIQWWMWYGYTMILLMAGITSIPTSLYEAALVDGATSRQTTWHITLPLLRPVMLYILVTSAIGGMQMFDIPLMLTNGIGSPDYKIRTTTVYQYNQAFGRGGNMDYAYGATVSVGVFVVTIILALLIFFFLQDRSDIKKQKGGKV